jgi:hypothetical protein
MIKMLKAEGKINNCAIENMRNHRLKPTLEKLQFEQIHRQRIRIYLTAQFHIKKSMLTIEPAFVIWIGI